MIYRICVIEDNPMHYEKIMDTLSVFKERNEHEMTIILSGIRVWETNLEDVESEITKCQPNIIILDHDLRWACDNSFNGLMLVDRLAKSIKPFPYVISSSGVMDEGKVSLEMIALTSDHEVTRKASTIIYKAYFIKPSERKQCFTQLQEALDETAELFPSMKLNTFQYPIDWEKTADLRAAKNQQLIRQKEYSDTGIVAILLNKNDFLILSLTPDRSSIDVEIIAGGHQFGVNDMRSILALNSIKSLTYNKRGIFYNPSFIEFIEPNKDANGGIKKDPRLISYSPVEVAKYVDNSYLDEEVWYTFRDTLKSLNRCSEELYLRKVDADNPDQIFPNPFYRNFRVFTG